MPEPVTERDTAPYLARVLLATQTGDHAAFVAALEDATTAGVTVVDLLVVTTRVLTTHLNTANPEWADQVRLGLIEGASA